MKVSDILKDKGSHVVTATPDATVLDAVRALENSRVGVLVVADDQRHVIGTLSETDVVRGLGTVGPRFLNLPIGSVMNYRPRTCRRDDDIRDVEVTITRERTRQLPVIDDDGVLVGIVSIGDVLKCRLDSTELELRVLRDYYVAHH